MFTCLITRPKHQAQHLAKLIEQAGGQCILFPTLEIIPLPINLSNLQSALEKAHKIIFTSANVVSSIAPHLSFYKLIPIGFQGTGKARAKSSRGAYTQYVSSETSAQHSQNLKDDGYIQIFAVGPATQKALQQRGIESTIPEAPEFNSEGLLKLSELTSVTDEQVVIFKGEHGRTLLQDTLQKRGAHITEISVYQRIKPNSDMGNIKEENIDWIISTSQESLKNLWEIAGEAHQPWLIKQHLLVISPAMKTYAQELGFLYPALVSPNASDEAILKTLLAKPFETSQIPKNPEKQ